MTPISLQVKSQPVCATSQLAMAVMRPVLPTIVVLEATQTWMLIRQTILGSSKETEISMIAMGCHRVHMLAHATKL